MTALRLTDGPPIPSTHVPPPVVYRTERVQVGRRLWWAGVPQACAECPGRLVEDDDRVVCVLCSREPYEVREKRPAPLPKFDDHKPGPKGNPTRCVDCGRMIHSVAKRCKWCNAVYQAKIQPELAAARKVARFCTQDGCDAEVLKGKSTTLRRQHYNECRRERDRHPRRSGVAS